MLHLGPADRERLVAGAVATGVRLDGRAVDRFASFSELLTTWMGRTRLVSCRTAKELVDRHLLDSLELVQLLPEHGAIVDLGSGAGFPGVPLAIMRPDERVVLVESRRVRASFLREVKRALALPGVHVMEMRAEEGPAQEASDAAAEFVVCRAVWSDDSILPIAARWLRPGGTLLWMRTRSRVSSPSPECGMLFEREHAYRIGDRSGVVSAFKRA